MVSLFKYMEQFGAAGKKLLAISIVLLVASLAAVSVTSALPTEIRQDKRNVQRIISKNM